MSTQAIIEKATALAADGAEKKAPSRKRQGAWETAEEFLDKDSGLGVIIRKRVRGQAAYSVSLVHFEERGPSRHIPYPLGELGRPLHEMAYLLLKKAEQWIQEHPLRVRKPRDGKKGGKKGSTKDRRSHGGGLSSLAQQDAQDGGHEHEGKTARKRRKRKEGASPVR